MKNNVLKLSLAAVLSLSLLAGCSSPAPSTPAPAEPAPAPAASESAPAEAPAPAETAAEAVELTMGSWRADDVAQMTEYLAEFTKAYPNITVSFQPTNPPDYNATLRLQLEGGTGPDLLYSRSYATGAELFESGYVADVSATPGLKENFTETALSPWQTEDGKSFAIPFGAVSHAVYYNKDIFAANNISVPTTWDDFMAACETLKAAGVTPLANGLADEWDILETFFFGMLPNYIGGPDQRALYENGDKKLNDEAFVKAYSDIAGVAPYLPSGFEAVTYNDSQIMFNTQSAAMFIDGSWTAGVYDGAPFEWGVFAIPAHSAADTKICFQADVAITMNAASTHPEESKMFLEWMCSQEGADAAAKYLPTGIFPMTSLSVTMEDPHAQEFLDLNNGRETDVRFVWPKLMDLYSPMNQAVIGVIKTSVTPQEAADQVQAAYDNIYGN